MEKPIGEFLRELEIKEAKKNYQENYRAYVTAIQGFLNTSGWRYSVKYDDSSVRFIYKSDRFTCDLRIDDRMIVGRTICPVISSIISFEDRDNVEEIMEFITRANMQLNFGAFKLDFNANMLFFQIAFPVRIMNGIINGEDNTSLDLLLTNGARTFNWFWVGFLNIGKLTPEEAILSVETSFE